MSFGDEGRPTTANDWVRANVRELMDARRWTQAEVTDRLHVSQPWLSKRLSGITPFQIEDLDALAAVFGITAHDLLCAGYGKWDRRSGIDRRGPADRRAKNRRTP